MKKSMVDSINYKNVRLTSSHRLKTLSDEKKSTCDDLAADAPTKKFIFKSKTQQSSSSGLSSATSHESLAIKQQPMMRSESNSGPKFKLKRYSSSDLELSPKKKRNSEPEETTDTFASRVSPNRTPKKIFKKSKSGSVEDEDDLFDGVVDLVGNIDSQIKKQCNIQTSPNDRKSQRLAARQASKDSKTPSPAKTSLPPSPPSSTASHQLEVAQQQRNKKKSPSPKKPEPSGLSKYSLDDLLNDDDDNITTETGQVKKSKFKLVSKTSSTSSGSLTSASQSTITLASSQTTVGASSSLASSSTSSMPKIFNFKARSNSNPTVFKIDFDDHPENGVSNEEKPALLSKQSSNETSTKSKSDIIYLRNSRKAYQCEQLGEEQAFMDNLNYLLDGLGSGNKLSDRCLSALKLAEECVSSEFRMSLRSMASYDDKQGSLLTRLFTPLEDSIKYKSLSLCTSLILYALTQDKLFMELNKQIFDLITRAVNWNEDNEDIEVSLNTSDEIVDNYSYLDDVRSVDAHERHVREYQQMMTPSRVRSSTSSSLANSPTGSATKDTADGLNEGTVADELVYKKISNNAWKIYKKLCPNYNLDQSITTQSSEEYEINFNPRLLFLDCLLNITRHTSKSLVANDLLRTELRENRIIDKIVFRTRVLFERIVLLDKLKSASVQLDNDLVAYLYSKLDASLFFLEILTQSSSHGSERNDKSRVKSGLKAILPPPSDLDTEQIVTQHIDTPVHTLNQNYLIDMSNNFVLKLIKTMMNHLYEEISEAVLHRDLEKNPIRACIAESVKQIFLFVINLTGYNEYTTSKILNDAKLLELLFKFVLLFNNDKYQPFDLNVMVLGALVNLFVYSYKQKSSLKLLRLKLSQSQTSFDIILNFYLAKEKMVILAEDNQENEFKRLSEQMSESHDTDNINKLIMNSIQQAGKHMEDHIIATHCALIIGYMLIDDDYVSDKKLIDVKKAKSKLMDGSFDFMVGVIKKFVVFMKILKATGFSADEHIQTITTYLSDL